VVDAGGVVSWILSQSTCGIVVEDATTTEGDVVDVAVATVVDGKVLVLVVAIRDGSARCVVVPVVDKGTADQSADVPSAGAGLDVVDTIIVLVLQPTPSYVQHQLCLANDQLPLLRPDDREMEQSKPTTDWLVVVLVSLAVGAAALPGTPAWETSPEPCRKDKPSSRSRSECLRTGKITKMKMGSASTEMKAEAAHVEAIPKMTSLWLSWLKSTVAIDGKRRSLHPIKPP